MSKIRPKILILDDEEGWAASVRRLLEDNYDVDIVELENEGVKKIREKSYDLLLLDYQLLRKKGTEVMLEIKQFNKVIPIILVSGKIGERGALIEAIQKGVTNYLEKDTDFAKKLPVAIEEALNGRDVVVLAVEKWLANLENPDEVMIVTVSGQKLSAKQIVEEVKKDSELGRSLRDDVVRVVLELILKGEIKCD